MDHLLFAASQGSGLFQYLGGAGSFLLGIIGLGIVIFVHELGHFLVAKACGVRCDKFYVGFDVPITIGPWTISALWKKQWGETEYGIGTIPLGGYVKMLGQDDNPGNSEEEQASTMIETTDAEGNTQKVVNPRSYTAKSVPQRMAIISAGVIFNLIFGVIFAAIAFNMGVSYTPAEIGWVQPGSPAWKAGIVPGDSIVGFSADGTIRPHVRFDKDMMVRIISNGTGSPMPFVVESPDGEKRVLDITPEEVSEESDRPTIGVAPMRNTEMLVAPTQLEMAYGKEIADSLHSGDMLIQINDEKIESFLTYQKYVANHPYEDLNLKLTRKGEGEDAKEEDVAVKLPTVPYRDSGLVMEMSPILAIREGSPAEKSGLLVGDKLVSINGEPVGNGFTLPSRETKWAGQTVEVVVLREGKEVTKSMQTAVPQGFSMGYYPGYEIGCETLGVSFNLGTVIAEVTPGSEAEKAGLVAGDEVLIVDFEGNSDAADEFNASLKIGSKKVPLTKDEIAWQAVQTTIQRAHPDTSVVLSVKKKSTGNAVNLAINTVASETEMLQNRYLHFQGVEKIQYASSVSDSLFLGVREVSEGMQQVVMVLRKIFSGEMRLSGLGGPATILAVATVESSHGIPRLLTFLTLISANLAVVNFLPIPVLDGGHMMFLLYEGIRGRAMNEKWMMRLTYIGLAMVLTLMLTVIFLDINRFSAWLPWG
ncbi:site-2 protease family protein [Bremerella sp. JC817]|uniref:site-2 protease family protein n=1 Tax=Bremerella sp. JC817 TaxID=3231756 RepID=UPI0034586D09